MIDVESMTQAEREALPWYGGNKIPDSYLRQWRERYGYANKESTENDDLPYELRLFLGEIGVKNDK